MVEVDSERFEAMVGEALDGFHTPDALLLSPTS
jgi:hypothetical protein